MAKWRPLITHKDLSEDMTVVKFLPAAGDTYPTKTMFDDRTGGVQFFISGSGAITNSDGKHIINFGRGERWVVPDPADLINRDVHVEALSDAEMYCVTSLEYACEWDGILTEIPPNTEQVISGMTGRWLLVTDTVDVDGTEYTAGQVVVPSTDNLTVTTTGTAVIVATIFKV